MKVLVISTDRKMFDPQSKVFKRMFSIAQSFEEFNVIVFSKKKLGNKKLSHGGRLNIIPTNSISSLLYISDAVKVADEYKYCDVVTTQDPFETGIVGCIIKKRHGLKLNIQVHTDISSPWFKNNIKNRIRIFISKSVFKKADSIRVVSRRIADHLNHFKNVRILPLYIDVSNKRHDQSVTKQFEYSILTISRLEPEKDVETLIRALSYIEDKRFGLVIVGDGSQRKYLEHLSKRLGAYDRVKFTGYQENTPAYYQTADIYAQASLYEGYGVSILEAADNHLPIVTTDVGLVGDVIPNSSIYIFKQGDYKALAKNLVGIVENGLERVDYNMNIVGDINEYAIQFKSTLE